jgi:hypothetical protein
VLAGIATAGVVALIALTRPDWLPLGPAAIPPQVATPPEPLPIPSPSEAALARARTLYADGRLRDALNLLDTIRPSDSLRRDADELRAAIQRRLLEAAKLPMPPAPGAEAARPATKPSSSTIQPIQPGEPGKVGEHGEPGKPGKPGEPGEPGKQ